MERDLLRGPDMRRSSAALLFVVLVVAPACTSGQAAAPPREAPRQAAAGPLVRPFRFGKPDIVLLVTDSTNGTLEPCNCPGGMPGGFSRRSGLIRSYRAAFPNLLLVDTGDAFRPGKSLDPRNEYLLRAYRQVGYDAIVLSDQEWSCTPGSLRSLVTAGKPEFLSTTANLSGSAALPLVREVKRSWGAAKIAILADAPRTSPPLLSPEAVARLSFAPPRRLPETVARLKREGYVVVVASHGVDAEITGLAESCLPDLALQGHFPTGNVMPQRHADPPVVRVGDYEYVSVFAWKLRGGKVADFEFRREAADERWPRDEELWQTYEAYAKVALPHAMATKVQDGVQYSSSAACGKCHEPQFAAWKASGHSHAYETLRKVGRDGDPDCLSCHTTGFQSVSGFRSLQATPGLANVNCQDCHGFSMKEHDAKGFRAPPIQPASCTRCHTPLTDPHFAFAARRDEAGCRR